MKRLLRTLLFIVLFFMLFCIFIPGNSGDRELPEYSSDNSGSSLHAAPAAAQSAPSVSTSGSVSIATSTPLEKTHKKLDCAYVAFTFDDGYLSDYELAFPILKKYGIRGTSYIIPEFQDENKPYTLTWGEIKEMYDYGWAFGCHTYAHSNLSLLTDDEIVKSMEMVNEAFTKHGIPAPVIGAYPFGKYNQRVIDALKPYRTQMRKAYYETKLVDINNVSPYEIDSVSADMRSEKRLKEHEAVVDEACKGKEVLVFRCHGLYKEQVNDMGEWIVQTDSRLFEQLVKYCVDKGCKFITMNDLTKMYS